jgi:hypothetical protein
MSQFTTPSILPRTWDDPNQCPFCTTELEDPGAGFMDHLEESPVCKQGFEQWRSSIAGDMGGEWSG